MKFPTYFLVFRVFWNVNCLTLKYQLSNRIWKTRGVGRNSVASYPYMILQQIATYLWGLSHLQWPDRSIIWMKYSPRSYEMKRLSQGRIYPCSDAIISVWEPTNPIWWFEDDANCPVRGSKVIMLIPLIESLIRGIRRFQRTVPQQGDVIGVWRHVWENSQCAQSCIKTTVQH